MICICLPMTFVGARKTHETVLQENQKIENSKNQAESTSLRKRKGSSEIT